jgi:hypothetical protein
MKNQELVTATDFCSCHQIEISFIQSLSQFGLIETKVISEEIFLLSEQLPKLEKIIEFHYDLNINLEGIEAIGHLIDKVENMHREIVNLRNRLSFYE